jgi:hypothetical protein
VYVEDVKDGIEYVPVFEQTSPEESVSTEMQLGNDFYKVALAVLWIPCDIDPTKVTHKGALWWITWQQACVSLCREFCCQILPLCDRKLTDLYLADHFQLKADFCHLSPA